MLRVLAISSMFRPLCSRWRTAVRRLKCSEIVPRDPSSCPSFFRAAIFSSTEASKAFKTSIFFSILSNILSEISFISASSRVRRPLSFLVLSLAFGFGILLIFLLLFSVDSGVCSSMLYFDIYLSPYLFRFIFLFFLFLLWSLPRESPLVLSLLYCWCFVYPI